MLKPAMPKLTPRRQLRSPNNAPTIVNIKAPQYVEPYFLYLSTMKKLSPIAGLLTVKKDEVVICDNSPAELIVDSEKIKDYPFTLWHLNNVGSTLNYKELSDIIGPNMNTEQGYDMTFTESSTQKIHYKRIYISEVKYAGENDKVTISFQGAETIE